MRAKFQVVVGADVGSNHLKQEQARRGRGISELIRQIAVDVECAGVQLHRVNNGARRGAAAAAPWPSRRIWPAAVSCVGDDGGERRGEGGMLGTMKA
jgi:hypothetical protein